MKSSRKVLGVLGELESHIIIVLGGSNQRMMKSLAIRYLLVETGTVLKRFCLDEYGSVNVCINELTSSLGNDLAGIVDKILRIREDLIESRGDVRDEIIEGLLNKVPELYVVLERNVPKIDSSRQR